MHELMGTPEPIRPEYRDREARLAVMDAQGLAKIWLFPTLGMLYEEALQARPRGGRALFRAFNRWLAEDWGMAYRDRIFASPYITLADVDEAVARARVGARPGRPHRRPAGRGARRRSRSPLARRRRCSTRSGPG